MEDKQDEVEDIESASGDSFINDSDDDEPSNSGQVDDLHLEEHLTEEEIEEIIAEFLEVESKAAEAQEALELESLAKVEREVKEELAQKLHDGDAKVHGNALMITSTITVVLFSTVVFGLMTKPLVRILLPSPKNLSRMLSSEPCTPKSFTMPLLGNGHDSEANQKSQDVPPRPTSLRMLLSTPSHTVHHYWRRFDNAFMRPVFGGRGCSCGPGSPIEQSVPVVQQWQ